MTRDTHAQALKLWVVLARAYSAVRDRAADHVAQYGLTLPEFGILEALYHKGPMLLCEVQRTVLVSSGGITYLVDRLTEKGLVERRECPVDRRARYATLTPAGTRLMRRLFPEHAAVLEGALAGISDAEQREAVRLLRDLGKYAASEAAAGG